MFFGHGMAGREAFEGTGGRFSEQAGRRDHRYVLPLQAADAGDMSSQLRLPDRRERRPAPRPTSTGLAVTALANTAHRARVRKQEGATGAVLLAAMMLKRRLATQV